MSNVVVEVVQKAGSQSALARQFNVSPQAVQQWVAAGKFPADRALEVSEAYDIPLERLLKRKAA